MTVLEKIIPFGWRNLSKKKVQDSWTMRKLKRKKKNLLTNAKRRGSAELYGKSRRVEKKIKNLIARSETSKIRSQVLTGGNQGLWKGIRMAQDRPIERMPTEMKIEEKSVNTRTEQARVFAKIFQEKIKDIAKE